MLAYTTSGDVRATWELAEIARRDQELRDRPMIVITSWQSLFGDPPADISGTLPITVRNIGLGPAESLTVQASYLPDPSKAEIYPGTVSAVMPGEEVSFELPVIFDGPTPSDAQYGAFRISGSYQGRLGDRYELQFAPHGHAGTIAVVRGGEASMTVAETRWSPGRPT